ncbi:MAG: hypothetical protein M0031_01070 [Thermaerobacter sp.]|nr:hypothetical protein [Thermaerobacter sp.]
MRAMDLDGPSMELLAAVREEGRRRPGPEAAFREAVLVELRRRCLANEPAELPGPVLAEFFRRFLADHPAVREEVAVRVRMARLAAGRRVPREGGVSQRLHQVRLWELGGEQAGGGASPEEEAALTELWAGARRVATDREWVRRRTLAGHGAAAREQGMLAFVLDLLDRFGGPPGA